MNEENRTDSHGADAPRNDIMDAEREARIRDEYIKAVGKTGVAAFARVVLEEALNAVKSGDEMLITIMLGGLRVVCDLLADAYDVDTTPYEVLMLETLEEATEAEEDYDNDDL